MTRVAAASLAACAAVAAGHPALAQSSSVWLSPPESSERNPGARWTGRILLEAARCVVSRHRGAAVNLLATVPETVPEWRVMYGPIRSRLQQCAVRLDVSPVLLRGAIAEVLYESAFSSLPVAGGTVAPLQWPADSEAATNLAPIYELGRCTVAGNAALVHLLLTTEPFSPEEGARLRELRPRLQPCLDRGVTFATDRETLRAVLAESLYHWAHGLPARP